MQTGDFSLSIFEVDEEKGLINLTRIARHFKKDIGGWSRNQSTKELIAELQKTSDMQICISTKGGDKNGLSQGTWGNREVALDFAQWISIPFKVFCLKHLDKLLQTGSTSLAKTPMDRHELIYQGYTALMQEREYLLEDLGRKAEQIKELAPAASYAKEVLQSANNWTITTIASELGLTAQKLNQKLRELKIQYKDSDGVWVLYAVHKDKGYTKSRTSTYHDTSNNIHTSITTTWTEKGRNFIHAALSQSVIEI